MLMEAKPTSTLYTSIIETAKHLENHYQPFVPLITLFWSYKYCPQSLSREVQNQKIYFKMPKKDKNINTRLECLIPRHLRHLLLCTSPCRFPNCLATSTFISRLIKTQRPCSISGHSIKQSSKRYNYKIESHSKVDGNFVTFQFTLKFLRLSLFHLHGKCNLCKICRKSRLNDLYVL